MSRFSKSEAESLGWRFVHNVDQDEVLTSGTQGEYRVTPETHVAEKYAPNGALIHEEGETMGKLLERIHLYEETQKRFQPESVEPVEVSSSPLNLDPVTGLGIRTVTIAADPEDLSEDKETIQITEEEWAARDRADVLVVRGEDGKPTQVTYGGSTDEVTDAYQAKIDHEAAIENARTALPDVPTKQVDLDPGLIVDAPGATGTGRLIVREDEDSMADVFERKQADKIALENKRVEIQSLAGPQGVAPEGQEDLVGVDSAVHDGATDLESEQPRMTQGEFETLEKVAEGDYEPAGTFGPTAEAQEDAQDAQSEAQEDAAKEARDEDLATADSDEKVAEVREAGLDAKAKAEEAPEADEVDATPAAAELAEEKGVDLNEVEGSGKDGRVVKADVEKAAE